MKYLLLIPFIPLILVLGSYLLVLIFYFTLNIVCMFFVLPTAIFLDFIGVYKLASKLYRFVDINCY